MQGLILIVDDEPKIVKQARDYLEKNGFQVISAGDGNTALGLARRERPDLIVLDLNLPAMDGLDVCRALRRNSDVPIIMLTARVDEADRLIGLELGADDYIVKPFSPRELVARVRAVLRRYQKSVRPDQAVTAGELSIDPSSREARLDGRQLDLRPKEFDLLLALAEHAGLVLSRDQLLDQVWGYDFPGGTRTVDAHISHLRSHLEGSDVGIETHRGIGYKLVAG